LHWPAAIVIVALVPGNAAIATTYLAGPEQQPRPRQQKGRAVMRKLRTLIALVVATATLGGAAFWLAVRPWWHRWGVDRTEAVTPLPGDDVVPNAPVSDTRALTIAAPPSAVWPWLVQMGFGRAGWYSYDALDMRGTSAQRILPEFQTLTAGEIVPAYPGGGFEVRVLEPGHALVLYLDTGLVRSQAEAAKATGATATPTNLQAGGALLGAAQPAEFAASWAFVLEPLDGDRTRLIERFRIAFSGGERPWTKYTLPLMGFGVFAMVRRQLLGIRDRVERSIGPAAATATGEP
jgi:hypothetical protein